jgi:hypothetical protein
MKHAIQARDRALQTLGHIAPNFKPSPSLESTLSMFPWRSFIENQTQPDQSTLHEYNLALDPRACLGKVALCFAIVERHFPARFEEFSFGEILTDWFQSEIMQQWTTFYRFEEALPDGWLQELLMYEEPHGVFVHSATKRQFDPLQVMIPNKKVHHPRIKQHNPWSAIASAQLVSRALQEVDPIRQIDLLDEAEEVCPGTCLVQENRVAPLVALEHYSEAYSTLIRFTGIRPTARLFFILETLFGYHHIRRAELYDEKLWEQIKDLLETEVQHAIV